MSRRPLFDPELERLARIAAPLGARMEFGRAAARQSGLLTGQDVLLPKTSTITLNTTGTLETPARDSYQSLVIGLLGSAAGQFVRADWNNFSTGQLFGSSSAVLNGSNLTTLIGPMSNNPGDNVGCNLTMAPGSAIAFACTMYGSRERLINVRPDGRPWPTGALYTANAIGAGSQTMIAAPGALLHINLVGCVLVPQGAGGSINGQIAGVANELIVCNTSTSPYPVEIGPQGLLLDANTPLTLVAAGASVTALAFYDITQ
jgi:hypothetical protein